MATEKELKYDEAVKRLEQLVDELDKSDLDLEARLKKFEEGTKLARGLVKRLEQAKKKVEVLVKSHVGEGTLIPFDDDSAEEPSRNQ
jgi:exodeoxyribonuclease VII small subunit